MPDINYEQLEESLRRSHKKSLGRFLIFLGFVLVLWIATYVVTKGQFSFFTKKIAVTDTLVIDQTSALQSKDSIIKEYKAVTDSLTKIIQKISSSPNTAAASRQIDSSFILKIQNANHRWEQQRKRDTLLDIKIRNYKQEYPNANPMLQMKQ